MSLFIPIPISEVKQAETLPSLTYRIDFTNGHIVGKIDELKAVEQAVKKAILTPRFKCLIYDNQYGSEIKQMLANNNTAEFMNSDVPRLIKDTLVVDERITDVTDFVFTYKNDAAYISFNVQSLFGEIAFGETL